MTQSDVDPDLDPEVATADPSGRLRWSVVAAVSAGGVVGALARYGLGVAFPHGARAFPWATFGINVSGCLAIGVLLVLIAEVWPKRTLLRPFLGTGVLGGYTTFSTYVVEIQHLATARAPGTALAYLAATLLAALAAVYAGLSLARATVRRIRRAGQAR